MVRMPLQVNLSGGGPVRDAVEVDLLVAQRGPHVVEVVHRPGRRVRPRVGVQARQAGTQLLGPPAAVVARRAPQVVRSAGAALVDQDHVPLPGDQLQELRRGRGGTYGVIARTAGQPEDRIG